MFLVVSFLAFLSDFAENRTFCHIFTKPYLRDYYPNKQAEVSVERDDHHL